MKTLSALLLVLALCLIPVTHAADKKTTPKADPKAATKTVAKDDKSKPEEAKPIIGALIERTDGSGGFLNLKVDGGDFVIVFLDKDKKEIEGDLDRAIIRYRRHLKNNRFFLTRSADGKSLRSTGSPVDRPYILPSLPVILFKKGQDELAESYVVQFNQPMAGDGEGIPADQMTPEQAKKVRMSK